MNLTQERYRRAKEFIPVGVGLLRKKPEAFSPGCWPAYHSKAKGCEVWAHVWKIGEQFTDILKSAATKYSIPLDAGRSFPTLNRFSFTENFSQMRPLYTTLMLDQGILASTSFYPTLAHNEQSLSAYAAAVDVVFDQMSDILRRGDLEKVIKQICDHDFERLVK